MVAELVAFGSHRWPSMSSVFEGCVNMVISATDAADSDFSIAADWSNAFKQCISVTEIPSDLNTSAGEDFSAAWAYCGGLTSFPSLDFENATSMAEAWRDCTSLTSFADFATNPADGATNCEGAWRGCSSLTGWTMSDMDFASSLALAWKACSYMTTFGAISTAYCETFESAWEACTYMSGFNGVTAGPDGANFNSAFKDNSGLHTIGLIAVRAGDISYMFSGTGSSAGGVELHNTQGSYFDHVTAAAGFLADTHISTADYYTLMAAWLASASGPPSNLTINFGGETYCDLGGGELKRRTLQRNYNWSITDGGFEGGRIGFYVDGAGGSPPSGGNDARYPFETVGDALTYMRGNGWQSIPSIVLLTTIVPVTGGDASGFVDLYLLCVTEGTGRVPSLTYDGTAGILTLGKTDIGTVEFPDGGGETFEIRVEGGECNITSISGNGGNGSNGSDGSAGGTQTGSNGANGDDGDPPTNGLDGEGVGQNGGDAGSGSSGAAGKSLILRGAIYILSLTAKGGNGGDGGTGGDGGEAIGGDGGDGGNNTGDGNGGDGGNGGDANAEGGHGGNGGNGGDGGTIQKEATVTIVTSVLTAGLGGNGGGGGDGGSATGGNGGNGGSGTLSGNNGNPGNNLDGPGMPGSNGSDGSDGSVVDI